MQCGCFLSGFSSQSEIDKEVFKGKKANHYDYEDDDDDERQNFRKRKVLLQLNSHACRTTISK